MAKEAVVGGEGVEGDSHGTVRYTSLRRAEHGREASLAHDNTATRCSPQEEDDCQSMSPPDHINWKDMDLEAAQPYYVLGLLPPEEVPSIAYNDLVRGRDGDALVELVSLCRPTWREIGTLMDRALEEIGVSQQPAERALHAVVERLLNEADNGTISLREAGYQIGMLTAAVDAVPEELLPLNGLEDYLELGLLTDEQWDGALRQECMELHARLEGSLRGHRLNEYGWGALYWVRRYGTPPE